MDNFELVLLGIVLWVHLFHPEETIPQFSSLRVLSAKTPPDLSKNMVDMEKSSRAAKIFVLFALVIVGDIFCAVVVPVETGQNYTFKSSVSGTPEAILWKFKKNKVVEYENNDQTWYRFETRAHLDIITGDFTLKQLRKEDSGQYESEIQVNGKLQYSNHEINVMDPVTKPSVTCEKPGEGEGIVLRCSLSPPVQADFSWSGPNGFTQSGQNIKISQKPGPNMVYYCTASNEVSRKSTQVNLQDCVKDGGLSGGAIAIIVVVVVVVVIILVGVLFVVYKKFIQEDAPESRVSKLNETV
ncbi:hypothetical protein AOLI_G00085820 [Acnodon oligacanthus]